MFYIGLWFFPFWGVAQADMVIGRTDDMVLELKDAQYQLRYLNLQTHQMETFELGREVDGFFSLYFYCIKAFEEQPSDGYLLMFATDSMFIEYQDGCIRWYQYFRHYSDDYGKTRCISLPEVQQLFGIPVMGKT